MKRISRIIWFTGIAAALFGSCKGPARLAYRNMADQYQPELRMPGLSYELFNQDDSITRLYVRFPYDNLRYLTEDGKTTASFRMYYQLYAGYEMAAISDSASFSGQDTLKIQGYFYDSVMVMAPRGKDYILSVTLEDVNAGKEYTSLLTLSKRQFPGINDFMAVDENGLPLMRNYIWRNERFRIRTSGYNGDLTIRRIPGKLPPASPPHSSGSGLYNAESDSSFTVAVSLYASPVLALPGTGRFVISQGNQPVLVLYRFYDGFPEIGSTDQMREALRYIATDTEYRELFNQPSRAAVDRFWVNLSGHSERALNQIRKYYGRVEEANRLYSISGEGWKSDRGMIYIVYGPPNIVYRNSTSEQWTYGEPGNPLSLRFLFNLEYPAGSPADYFLIRSDTYRNPWHLAVSNWRR